MFDPLMRRLIDRPLKIMGQALAHFGFTANTLTLLGFMLGLCTMLCIAKTFYTMAMLFLCCNRLCDGLDGALARQNHPSDFGGFLDIVCDMIVYSGVVFSFGIADASNWPFVAFLMLSFVGPMASFLAYATIAEKRKHATQKRGVKSFYYSGGICEGTETFIVLFLMCWFYDVVNMICITYGLLCWITTFERAYQAWQVFR